VQWARANCVVSRKSVYLGCGLKLRSDIAHRNDIPKDLKDEIKHTLQNKLHRNAGATTSTGSILHCAKLNV
jgi:hypothetical protein